MNSHDPMIETNDPRLTAYVLGELAPTEIAPIEDALKSSPELRAAVDDIRKATETISNVFQAEPSLQLSPEQKTELLAEAESAANTDVHSFPENVTPTVTGEHYRPSSGSTTHWLKIAVAAGLASLLLGGAYYFTEPNRSPIAASDKAVLDSTAEQEESAAPSKDQFRKADQNEDLDTSSLQGDSAIPLAASDGIQANKNESKKQTFAAPQAKLNRATPAMEADSFGDMGNSKQSRLPAIAESPSDGVTPARRKDLAKIKSLAKGASDGAPSEMRAALAGEFNVASNSPMLLRAQQSIDQSNLRSLNLKVIAQNPPNELDNSQRGTGSNSFGAARQQPGAPAELAAKHGTFNHGAIQSSRSTFKLQISTQDAKQMVQLLASQADPLQQRRLSFNELIGLQKASSVASRAIASGMQLSDVDKPHGINGRDLKLETDSAASDAKMSLHKSEAPQNAAPKDAATMLATKLREHIRQPFYRYNNATADQPSQPIDGIEDLTKDGSAAASEPTLNTPSAPKQLAGGKLLKPLTQEAKPSFAAIEPNERLRSSEFNFDYTQVIQQLKSNLEIRNQSVNPLKQ